MSEFSGLIRPVEEMDRDEWLRMRDALWPNGLPEEHLAEMEVYQVRGGLDICLVAARSGGGLCGFVEVSVRPFAEGSDARPVGYIEGWFVDADVRRRGIGRQLIRAAEQWAENLGLAEMASDCLVDNEASWQAHLALGYQEAERLIHFRKEIQPSNSGRQTVSEYIYLTRPTRPDFFEGTTDQENTILSEHFAHLKLMVEAGRAILAGPCLDQTFGIVIVRANSLEEARSLMQADPAVRNGVMSAELHPFRVSLMGRKGP
jgi:aminoglycoside 6'-N-acetyltransferase I